MELFLAAGDAVDTQAVFGVDSAGHITMIASEGGDGTVTRRGAVMDERTAAQKHHRLISPIHCSGVLFLFTDHLGLTAAPAFSDPLLYLLLEDPRSEGF